MYIIQSLDNRRNWAVVPREKMNPEALQSMAELVTDYLPDDSPRCFEAKKTTDTSMVFAHDPSSALFENLCILEQVDERGEYRQIPNYPLPPHIPYAHTELAIQLPLAYWRKQREKLRWGRAGAIRDIRPCVANFELVSDCQGSLEFDAINAKESVCKSTAGFIKVQNGFVYRLAQVWGENAGISTDYFLDSHCRRADNLWALGRCRATEFYCKPPDSPLRDAAKSFSRSIQYVTTANGAGMDLQCGGKKTIQAIKELRALAYGF